MGCLGLDQVWRAGANNLTSCCTKEKKKKGGEKVPASVSDKRTEPAEAHARSSARTAEAFSTYQTSVENVKQPLRRNHVGLRKDYNTIYLEKHNVTPGDVTWDS